MLKNVNLRRIFLPLLLLAASASAQQGQQHLKTIGFMTDFDVRDDAVGICKSVMEGIALYTGHPFIMAMSPVQTVMVTITLIAAAINLNDGATHAIEGMTRFLLFATFVILPGLGL